ncbi:hypothetical protein PSTAB_1575 [Stutzerimonas stutzeri]|uniref:Uncharacterized protein n=1 Tax=Stutzerimonas stutzeri (strain ATCC 17588 / DSM 5190 / CCUG 11256 / JCM 5965 / LMG 11199 / NBRC 14165 / NCIMB 11358 / Stanier 221) TaxID=96563 RepID=F8H6B0_STUS2|nr:hypothetical protein PSTAB_1575 [Stutzerimonas stutzeri]
MNLERHDRFLSVGGQAQTTDAGKCQQGPGQFRHGVFPFVVVIARATGCPADVPLRQPRYTRVAETVNASV